TLCLINSKLLGGYLADIAGDVNRTTTEDVVAHIARTVGKDRHSAGIFEFLTARLVGLFVYRAEEEDRHRIVGGEHLGKVVALAHEHIGQQVKAGIDIRHVLLGGVQRDQRPGWLHERVTVAVKNSAAWLPSAEHFQARTSSQ